MNFDIFGPGGDKRAMIRKMWCELIPVVTDVRIGH
jgi:hypothetical protein